MNKYLLPLLFCLLYANWVSAQTLIGGKVRDEQGTPLIGAAVTVKGTSTGTITDVEGSFRLQLTSDATELVVSYIGYVSTEVTVGNQTEFDIVLQPDILRLDELVVTGYGTQMKRDLTGAVTSVDLNELSNMPAAGIDEMIQGRATGVSVLSDNAPGGGVAVRIRGFSTIRNNDPLYIIDGIPTTGGINMINPNDIESFQVLKDASAASIYGSRAANGVVIITTRKGKSEQTQINFNGYAGVQTVANMPTMLNAAEYGDKLWEASLNDGVAPSSPVYGTGPSPVIPTWIDAGQTIPSDDVDWVSAIFKPALIQSYNLDFSKRTATSGQFTSFNFFQQDGMITNTGFERLTGRINTDYRLFDRVTVGQNLTAAYSWTTQMTTNQALGSIVYDAYRFPSISPIYDINGNFAGSATNDIQNPLGRLDRNKDNAQRRLKLFGNVFIDADLIGGLSFKSNLGINYDTYNTRQFNPRFTEIYTQRLRSDLNTVNQWGFEWVWSNTLNYNKSFGKSSLNALGGVEAIQSYQEGFTASRVGFAYDDPNFRYLDAGDVSDQRNSGTASEWSLFSYFGRMDYSFDGRYLASVTVRRDGSSKLTNNKWGTFPAFSLGWRISNESFFNTGVVNDLKIRAGWGQTGNQDIPPYSTFSSYRSFPNYSNYAMTGAQNQVNTGLTETRKGNPNLKWETTTQTNVGVDMALFNSRIGITADYFLKETEDMLIELPLPPVMGGTNQFTWQNAGRMKNQGFEINLQYFSKNDRPLTWSMGINATAMRNELLELPDEVAYIALPSSMLHVMNFGQEVTRSTVGQPIASFYGYTADGLFQSGEEVASHAIQPNAKPGDIRFRDINGDGVLDSQDRTFIGNPHPDLIMGVNFNAAYKGFDFNIFLYGNFGNETYDLTRYYLDFFNLSAYNKHNRTLNAWRPDNTSTDLPRLSLSDPNNNIRPSSYYVFNGSFLRLRNMQIGYTLPSHIARKLEASQLRLFFQAQNLFTITSYPGLDPEVGLQNYNAETRNLDIGVDRGIYPPNRTFTLGLTLSF